MKTEIVESWKKYNCLHLFVLSYFRPISSKLEIVSYTKSRATCNFFGLVSIIAQLFIKCNGWPLCLDISDVSNCLSKGLSFILKCSHSFTAVKFRRYVTHDHASHTKRVCFMLTMILSGCIWWCIYFSFGLVFHVKHCLKFLLRHLMLWRLVKQLTSIINGIRDEKFHAFTSDNIFNTVVVLTGFYKALLHFIST